jgi:excisionase family DNA binding protein
MTDITSSVVAQDTLHDDVLTLPEAAALLRVHPVTLRRRAKAWSVPHRRLGSEWRFSRQVLTAWLQQGYSEAA